MMTIQEALSVLDDLNVCKDCEAYQEGYWGGCYRRNDNSVFACDRKDEALNVLREALEGKTDGNKKP